VPDNVRLLKRPAITASESPINQAIAYGVNAPNPHNTQAWRFKNISDLETLLYVDEHRLLPMTDPPARQIHIGCGCFIETLTIGATGMGYETSVEYLPEGSYALEEVGRKPVARISLDKREGLQKDEFYDYIFERQTNRKNYGGRPLSIMEVGALRKSFSSDGSIEFLSANESEEMRPLFDIFYKAMEIECMTRRLYEETRIWFRFSEKERAEKRDGLSVPQMGMEGLKKAFLEWYLNKGNPSRWFSKTSISRYLALVKQGIDSSRGIVFLKTRTNNQLDWIKTGRVYARICLAAIKHGLSMQPQSQVLQEYPEMRELQVEFNRLLGVKGDEKVQMAARIGRAERAYYPYRRNLPSFSE
jgi:Nitroreductase family